MEWLFSPRGTLTEARCSPVNKLSAEQRVSQGAAGTCGTGPGEQRAGHPKTWPGAPLCAPRESLGVVGGRKRGGLQLSLGSKGSELKPGSLLQGSGGASSRRGRHGTSLFGKRRAQPSTHLPQHRPVSQHVHASQQHAQCDTPAPWPTLWWGGGPGKDTALPPGCSRGGLH